MLVRESFHSNTSNVVPRARRYDLVNAQEPDELDEIETMTLYVGPRMVKYTLPIDLICGMSPVLEKMLHESLEESGRGDRGYRHIPNAEHSILDEDFAEDNSDTSKGPRVHPTVCLRNANTSAFDAFARWLVLPTGGRVSDPGLRQMMFGTDQQADPSTAVQALQLADELQVGLLRVQLVVMLFKECGLEHEHDDGVSLLLQRSQKPTQRYAIQSAEIVAVSRSPDAVISIEKRYKIGAVAEGKGIVKSQRLPKEARAIARLGPFEVYVLPPEGVGLLSKLKSMLTRTLTL